MHPATLSFLLAAGLSALPPVAHAANAWMYGITTSNPLQLAQFNPQTQATQENVQILPADNGGNALAFDIERLRVFVAVTNDPGAGYYAMYTQYPCNATWTQMCTAAQCNIDVPGTGYEPDGATWMPMSASTGALLTVNNHINIGKIVQSTFSISGSGRNVVYTYTNKYIWTPSGISFGGICDLAYDAAATPTKLYISYGASLAVADATPLLTPSGAGGTLTFSVLTSSYSDCYQLAFNSDYSVLYGSSRATDVFATLNKLTGVATDVVPEYKAIVGTDTIVDLAGSGAIPMNCTEPPPTPEPTAAPTLAPTSGTCMPSKAASAWTSPGGKVAPYKAFTYNAQLKSIKPTLSAAASAQTAKLGAASPLADVVFTLPIPAGVNVLAFTSTPKLPTAPTFDNSTRLLTWTLGTVIRPGKGVKLSLKLQPTACTTPDALKLDGKFAYTDATGAKTAGACLKKPLYVWTSGCPAIPKPTMGSKPSTGGSKPGKPGSTVYTSCTCSMCECVKGQTCSCPEQGCTCGPAASSV